MNGRNGQSPLEHEYVPRRVPSSRTLEFLKAVLCGDILLLDPPPLQARLPQRHLRVRCPCANLATSQVNHQSSGHQHPLITGTDHTRRKPAVSHKRQLKMTVHEIHRPKVWMAQETMANHTLPQTTNGFIPGLRLGLLQPPEIPRHPAVGQTIFHLLANQAPAPARSKLRRCHSAQGHMVMKATPNPTLTDDQRSEQSIGTPFPVFLAGRRKKGSSPMPAPLTSGGKAAADQPTTTILIINSPVTLKSVAKRNTRHCLSLRSNPSVRSLTENIDRPKRTMQVINRPAQNQLSANLHLYLPSLKNATGLPRLFPNDLLKTTTVRERTNPLVTPHTEILQEGIAPRPNYDASPQSTPPQKMKTVDALRQRDFPKTTLNLHTRRVRQTATRPKCRSQ
ncbi:hypothetical protein FA15DRAFT_513641 [Coprinopsis marcescibilis]|uniref:Uncharacterized protein n=1 Tax=Coprinopsis marcescibilis TaxID=230819 RepID=A0A5C3KQC5_COPMA|nr:hypothetical protein FA15DRAFT_513641 [Coprinopsis marcescibilis]